MASSAGPAHRIMSDLSAFIGHRDPATHRILAAGDLNLCYGATGGTLSLPTRARRRRRSRPVAACAAIAGRPVVCGQGAIRRAQTGGVRRPCGPSACGGEPVPGGSGRAPYAVVRRTRRRGGAGRGLAGCARPRGVACACCAR